ncbi:HECT-domain (ubiquitin-transferase) domain-containing protein [Sarocladium implicatum]|nr:HECT-domain (ubiquitin-transferase) domain-containing protein [Sarocladium implicatum]
MFSTFTGNSRRPRNVNLSGQSGNPFTNTSWSPSLVSNASKTVSNAQADRERRQADKQRLKAAGQIQKTWRGHRTRQILANNRRAEFDALYSENGAGLQREKVSLAALLVLSFFTIRRPDDLQRLVDFAQIAGQLDVKDILPAGSHLSRLEGLAQVLVSSLQTVALQRSSGDVYLLIHLLLRVVTQAPAALSSLQYGYFAGLAQLCQNTGDAKANAHLLEAIAKPLELGSKYGLESILYRTLADQFLAYGDLPLLQRDIEAFAKVIDVQRLSAVINSGHKQQNGPQTSNGEPLWLVAHFIHLGRSSPGSSNSLEFLGALYTQLSLLSSEIGMRMNSDLELSSSKTSKHHALRPLDPYVSGQLLSLVETEGIAGILRDFSASLAEGSEQGFWGNSILAGLFFTILTCFPAQADATRMKLFLEQIQTPSGTLPLLQIMWTTMSQTKTFAELGRGPGHTTSVLRDFLAKRTSTTDMDEQEWRIILLFLDMYTFVLRLSDDEEFLHGLDTNRMQLGTAPVSRLQSCSLSLDSVKLLTQTLKHTALALYSNVPEVLGARVLQEKQSIHSGRQEGTTVKNAAHEFENLRNTVTSALKMLYERDSRLHFLPPDFWLMIDKFDKDGFINAVVEEEQAQRDAELQDDSDSEEDASDSEDLYSASRTRTSMLRNWQRNRKERRLAEIGPKLEVLKHMPFVVPFETRVKIFRKFIQMDREGRGSSSFFMDANPRHAARIRRGRLFDDAYNAFFKIGDGLKDLISITFVDKFGNNEAGIDGGGVTKEFLTSVIAEAFGAGDEDLHMFTTNSAGLVYPNPTAVDVLRERLRKRGVREGSTDWNDAVYELLNRYEFLGRIFGKCMYEGILVDVAFAGFFLLKWPSPSRTEQNSYKGSVNDLRDMDEELYRGLLRLKNHQGDVSELGIDFTITDQVSPPGEPSKTITRNLIPNGDQVIVTNDNRLLYNSYVARHRLVLQPALQTQAFLRGLRAMIRPTWLSMFNQTELQRLEGGDSSEIDIEDLRANTIYSGLYEIGDDQQEHPTVKLFWKVMVGFTDAQRRDVIKYVSSTPRAPLLGFSQLSPKFSIRDSGRDEERLPSTSTCVNLLKLPMYTKESTLREKLLYAVTSGAGFDLS